MFLFLLLFKWLSVDGREIIFFITWCSWIFLICLSCEHNAFFMVVYHVTWSVATNLAWLTSSRNHRSYRPKNSVWSLIFETLYQNFEVWAAGKRLQLDGTKTKERKWSWRYDKQRKEETEIISCTYNSHSGRVFSYSIKNDTYQQYVYKAFNYS